MFMLKNQRLEKKRTTIPKKEIPNPNPIASISSLSQGVSKKTSHQRGLINNEIQQTIIQQIKSLPDPRLDKLYKRTKLKEQLKRKQIYFCFTNNTNNTTISRFI